MLESLITSKTRIKLLLKFFFNSQTRSYLRSLESEFGESSNAIRVELNKMEKAGLLQTEVEGNKKLYQANVSHPLFGDIHSILRKHIGIDSIIEEIVLKLGELKSVYIVGDFARGHDSSILDLVLVGEKIDQTYLHELVEKVQKLIKRKIRVLTFKPNEKQELFEKEDILLVWGKK